MLAATLPRRQAPRLGLGAVRFMSRVGKLPVKVPPSVTIKIEAFPESAIMPFKPLTPKRRVYCLRNRPSGDCFAAFGSPTLVRVEGPLGTLQLPVHSFCQVQQTDGGSLEVTPQCGGKTKLGKTLWGTTRGYLANAVRGVSQGFRKELELHGVGFKARVEPAATAAPPAGELVHSYKLGVEAYGESFHNKQTGPPGFPDPMRGGALSGGAGGGWNQRQPPLRPAAAPVDGDGAVSESEALMMRIGFSHEVRVDFPPHLKVSTPTPTMISIFGIDKQQVGLAAQRVRLLRKPDAYKGKGIRYVGEVVRLKQGKRR